MDRLSDKEAAFFAPALTLVPALTQVLTSNKEEEQRIADAQKLIEAQLVKGSPDKLQAYLGCLMIGFVRNIIREGITAADALQKELATFIRGDYLIGGKSAVGYTYDSSQRPPQVTNDGSTINLNVGNQLALWKICELELEKQCGDKTLAKRLAASTLRITAGDPQKINTVLAQNISCDAIRRHHCNPYEHASIFEFAGSKSAFSDKTFPLIGLFQRYNDYTPDAFPSATINSELYISRTKPGRLRELAKEHYDYVIASNVFCVGAIKPIVGPSSLEISGPTLLQDIMPHLANILADKGCLIISNTAKDGIDYTAAAYSNQLKLLGLRTQEAMPLLNDQTLDKPGISVLQRDYQLHAQTIMRAPRGNV